MPLEVMPKLATADEMWAYLQKFKSGPGRAASPEDGMRRIRAWLDRQRNVAEQFVAKYPDDPRRWEAQTCRSGGGDAPIAVWRG
jgi:hypothetical protein